MYILYTCSYNIYILYIYIYIYIHCGGGELFLWCWHLLMCGSFHRWSWQ